MKADARPDEPDDEGRESLRAVLLGWSAPAVPATIEDGLRAEFRRRRRRPRPAVWLSLAAVLGLLAAWPFVASRPAERPAAAPLRSSVTAPTAPPPRLEPAAPRGPSVVARPAAARRAASRKPPKPAVVVEPGQAELLAQLGRRAWERTEAAAGASLPSMPAEEAPTYGADWKEVAGEWPAVQVVVPRSER